MSLIKPIAQFFEARQPFPVWRHFGDLFQYYLRLGVWWRQTDENAELRDRFCPMPFRNFEMLENGSVFLCCSRWLPTPAGNLHAQAADEIWNSPRAQDIRRSILDGDFKYCDHNLCPAIVGKSLPTRARARKTPALRAIIDQRTVVMEGRPKHINLTNDRSCNLSCPSCRTKRLNFSMGRAYEIRKRLQDRVTEAFFSNPTDEAFTVNVTGSGDPFASRIYREFLYGLERKGFPNLRVNLQTNGTLFNEKTWKKLNKVHGNINAVVISFDAGCEETYKVTRRGGSWYHLVKNTEFLSGLRQRGMIGLLRLDYVVQRANFRDMPQFVELGKRLRVDRMNFSKAVNWGTWSLAEYRDVCVWDPDHPEFAEFQRIVSQPIFEDRAVSFGNLTKERERACAGAPRRALAV